MVDRPWLTLLSFNVDGFLRLPRRMLRFQLDGDAAEDGRADVVDRDRERGRDAASDSGPQGNLRQYGTEHIQRNVDIEEFEDGVQQHEQDGGQDSRPRRYQRGDLDGGEEADALECVGHRIVQITTYLSEACFVHEIFNQGLHV